MPKVSKERIRRFDVWIADLNPRIGTESGKTRPVVVVQTDLLNDSHPSTLICPVTTNIVSGSEILRVNLSKSEAGLKAKSAIMVDQLRAIDNKRLIKRTGSINEDNRSKLLENLKIVLDLNL